VTEYTATSEADMQKMRTMQRDVQHVEWALATYRFSDNDVNEAAEADRTVGFTTSLGLCR